MAILESVRELASKLGAETNGRDITDQLNKINKHLDEAALSGRDIAEAVKTYSENASGGGGSFALKAVPIPNINLTGTSGSIYSPVSEGVFNIMIGYNDTDAYGNNAYLSQPASRINITTYDAGSGTIYFTPAETFDGFYQGDNKMTLDGDTITPGDGYVYKAAVDRTSQYPNMVTITKYSAGPQVIPNA